MAISVNKLHVACQKYYAAMDSIARLGIFPPSPSDRNENKFLLELLPIFHRSLCFAAIFFSPSLLALSRKKSVRLPTMGRCRCIFSAETIIIFDTLLTFKLFPSKPAVR